MRRVALIVGAVFLAGCYHATINTGLAPSAQVVEQPWAHSFIGGLVPPATLATQQQCPKGVSQVETQMSVVNLLANIVTGGIYSPMTIKVTCAQ